MFELHEAGYTAKNCLVILVFSGHGLSDLAPPQDRIRADGWTLKLCGAMNARGTPSTPTLDWNMATSAMNSSECDVVHILDCCFAAEVCNGGVEILGASARNEPAEADPATCFTEALIEELRRLSSRPTTIVMLFSEIMVNRRAHGLLSTPFYNRKPGKESVILPTKCRQGKNKAPQIRSDSARILVTAHVDEILGVDVTLEGVWNSSSSIIMFSMPVCVWSQLNSFNGAFTYVGEVTSRNYLLEQSAQGRTKC
ncbi:hypothetical protein Ptr902_11763 [Pyrenophora tritici-repentis]|nr:hypothetical protein Ptr902_11763 [Pyrenophora tritici-repentis]